MRCWLLQGGCTRGKNRVRRSLPAILAMAARANKQRHGTCDSSAPGAGVCGCVARSRGRCDGPSSKGGCVGWDDVWEEGGMRSDLIVGVDDGVGGHALGVVGLGPGVDGVNVGFEDGEHSARRRGWRQALVSGSRLHRCQHRDSAPERSDTCNAIPFFSIANPNKIWTAEQHLALYLACVQL